MLINVKIPKYRVGENKQVLIDSEPFGVFLMFEISLVELISLAFNVCCYVSFINVGLEIL